MIVYDIITRIQQLGLPPNRVKHECDIRDLATDYATDMCKCVRICCQVPGTLIERVWIGVGMEVARDLVIDTEDILDVWKLGKVRAKSI